MFYFFAFERYLCPLALATLGCRPIRSEAATLHDARISFTVEHPERPGRALASLEMAIGETVHGVLHTLRDDHLRALCRAHWEGSALRRVERVVSSYRGHRAHAFLFVGAARAPALALPPSEPEEWMKQAHSQGLAPEYLAELAVKLQLSPGATNEKAASSAALLSPPRSPAGLFLSNAEKRNEQAGHENYGFLSRSHGLMPRVPPISGLGSTHQAWDEIARELPSLYRSQSLRVEVDELDLLPADASALADKELLRACSVLAMLAHAYWYVEPTPPRELPRALAQPWRECRARLGRGPEVLNYIDLIVYNWRLVSAQAMDPMRLENMRLMIPTVDNREERTFYLTQAEILARASPAVQAMTQAHDAVLEDDAEALLGHLSTIHSALSRIVFDSLLKINPNPLSSSHVDAVVWAKTVAPFAVPFHPDVQGPSGTSSPIFNCLDIFFGRRKYESFLGREIKNLRETYPPAWQGFLESLAKVSVEEYVARKQNDALSGAFRELFQLYAGDSGFLGRHRMKVYSYLEVAFKVGRSVTIGGFGGVFKDRTWDEVDNELEASRSERTRHFPEVTGSAQIYSVSPGARVPDAGVQHVCLDVRGAGVRYEAGDRCAILPRHSSELVERTLTSLGAQGHEQVPLSAEWKATHRARRLPEATTSLSLRELLQFGMIRPVTMRLAEALHAQTQSPILKHAIQEQNIDHWELWELLEALKKEGFDPGSLWQGDAQTERLARLIPPEKFRMYSISSVMQSAHVEPAKTLELTVGRLRYGSRHSATECFGTASNFLATAAEHGSELSFYLEHPPRFQLPPDPRTPVIFLAGGTGFSPFRAFLKERIWTRPQQAWLFLGLRSQQDFCYEADLLPGLQNGTLRIDVAFSRDDVQVKYRPPHGLKFAPAPRGRIEDRLLAAENSERLSSLLRNKEDGGEGAFVYICGRSGFAKSIWATLERLLMRHYEGTPTPLAHARHTLHRLAADGRLMQELYSDSRATRSEQTLYDISEVARHNNDDDGYWMILDGSVYDLTDFMTQHPGGSRILKGYSGLDASEGFARAHQGRTEIAAMQEIYLLGPVRRLEFGHGEATAEGPSGPVLVSPGAVYRAWVKALMLTVEMQNALTMDQALQQSTVIERDGPELGSSYKLSRSLESHQRFLRSHLDLLMDETLPRLWSITQPLFAAEEQPGWASRRLGEIRDSTECRWSEALGAELFAPKNRKRSHDRRLQAASLFELEDRRFLADLKAVLIDGVSLFEQGHIKGSINEEKALIQTLRSSIDVVAGYFSHLVEELHKKGGFKLSNAPSSLPPTALPSAPPRRLLTVHYWSLDEYTDRKLVILRRSPAVVTSLEDLAAENSLILSALGVRYTDYGLVVDLRQAPVRNDPEFESTMSNLRLGLLRSFKRTAVLIESAIGVLQVNRLRRIDQSNTLATQSESTAIKFALGDR